MATRRSSFDRHIAEAEAVFVSHGLDVPNKFVNGAHNWVWRMSRVNVEATADHQPAFGLPIAFRLYDTRSETVCVTPHAWMVRYLIEALDLKANQNGGT